MCDLEYSMELPALEQTALYGSMCPGFIIVFQSVGYGDAKPVVRQYTLTAILSECGPPAQAEIGCRGRLCGIAWPSERGREYNETKKEAEFGLFLLHFGNPL